IRRNDPAYDFYGKLPGWEDNLKHACLCALAVVVVNATALTNVIPVQAAPDGGIFMQRSLGPRSAKAPTNPSMTTSSSEINLTQPECLERGASAVRQNGFTTRFEVSGNTIFGGRGEYTVGLVCAAYNQMVFFAIAGPGFRAAADRGTSYLRAIRETFLQKISA